MHKLKPDRQRACSPKSIDRIMMIIAQNWDETWGIVQLRAKSTKTINLRHLRNLREKSLTH
jgi:hypothetical protein